MNVSFAIHLIGIITWVGPLLVLAILLRYAERTEGLVKAARRTYYGYVIPGVTLTALTGLHQLGARGIGYYFSQGWFIAKFVMVLGLLWCTWSMKKEVDHLSQGVPVDTRPVRMVQGIGGLAFVVIILLMYLGRGSL